MATWDSEESQQTGPPSYADVGKLYFSDCCDILKKMAGDEVNDPTNDVLRKKVRIREGHRQYVQQLLAQIEDGKDNQAASKVTRTQLKEKLRKLEILDKEILELVGEVETDDATACVREIGIASEFKGRILAGLTRLDDILSQKPPPQVPEGRPLMERNGSFESLSSTAT